MSMHDPRFQQAALEAYDTGIQVLPTAGNGQKAPYSEWFEPLKKKTWDHFKTALIERKRLMSLFANGRTSLGFVTGPVSGNLIALDFDCRQIYERFVELAYTLGMGDLIAWIEQGYCEDTPSGGVHWLFRCNEIAGNTELAKRPTPTPSNPHSTKVLIETRETGGFIVTAPSTGYKGSGSYVLRSGDPTSIVTITPEERQLLWDLARTFDEMPKAGKADPFEGQATQHSAGWIVRPGDDFKARATWGQILQPAGWIEAHSSGETTYWRRPDKDKGVSGTTGHGQNGKDWFHVFTSSTVLEAGRNYSKFGLYVALAHNGDVKAATKQLIADGYGKPDPAASKNSTSGSGQTNNSTPEPEDIKGLSDADLGIRHATEVTMEAIVWLWEYFLALGKLSLIAGDGGNGKSQFALATAAAISTGSTLPNGEKLGTPARVIIVSAEDAPEDTVLPRLVAMGADPKNITFLKPQVVIRKAGQAPLVHPQAFVNCDYFNEVLRRLPDTVLLIVDTLPSYLGRGVNDAKNIEVRQILEPFIEQVLQPASVSMLGIVHLNKGGDSKTPVHRILGSVAYSNLARAVYFVVSDAEQPGRSLFVLGKCNLAPRNVPAIAYRIEAREVIRDDGIVIKTSAPVFESEPVHVNLHEMFSGNRTQGEKQDHKRQAAEWLKARLEAGPIGSHVCAHEGDAHLGRPWDLANRTDEDRGRFIGGRTKYWREGILKDRLGGSVRKYGMAGGWFFYAREEARQPSMEAIAEAARLQAEIDGRGEPDQAGEWGTF